MTSPSEDQVLAGSCDEIAGRSTRRGRAGVTPVKLARITGGMAHTAGSSRTTRKPPRGEESRLTRPPYMEARSFHDGKSKAGAGLRFVETDAALCPSPPACPAAAPDHHHRWS